MRFSIEIDPELVEQLSTVQVVCLVASGVVACVVLAAWFVPAVAHGLPSSWSFTKANTAFIALLSTVSLALSHPRQSRMASLMSRAFAGLVGLITLSVLPEYLFHFTFRLELLLPHDRALQMAAGRMSPFTAADFALLALVTLLLTERKNVLSGLADITMCLLSISVLANVAGWIFSAFRLFGVATTNKVGPATMICLLLLTFVAFGRRAEHGAFAIMLGLGLGSRVSRIAFPLAFVLPFALEAGRGIVVRDKVLSPEYASAISTTLAVLLAFLLILVLAWRVLSLEREILDLSLRDELTKLYNRRGFFLMAEQALWLAQRSGFSFSVLFVDLDGLKRINDTKGHDVGSNFICEAAELLQQVVRRTDVVGRVGGDEFVMAGQWDENEMRKLAERLRAVVEERNAFPGRIYPFSLSLGYVSSNGSESLQDLLQQADIAMYESKHRKKSHRG